MYIIN